MDNNSMEKFEEKVIQVSRVSKKTKGGNKVRFAALVVVGDRRGKVGIGLGKSGDVAQAIAKAVSYAKRRMIFVPIHNETITQQIRVKKGAAQVLLKPAPKGTGIIAGGAIRSVVEVAGIRNISSKILGSSNKAGNAQATFEALTQLAQDYETRENN
ncbi:MAG: 30S ribosomal protein S5 [Candidatus Levybacteria bacterium]|nr:30S ribosomal protein S5 [Candidatus Levybacteria bacterium]MBP9814874.1 30S ribosomal protein S5 [Candidatus Levybacteria bacterium]